MSERTHEITVQPLPLWLDAHQLLGAAVQTTAIDQMRYRASLTVPAKEAADVAARLRGLGVDGQVLEVAITPALSRSEVRDGRLRDARARRDTTKGFLRPAARANGEGRYSLTPEALALQMAREADNLHVIDACCGAGGNAIGFARAGAKVTAIERDATRLAEARHNASVYGVADQIRFLHGDARELVPEQTGDILFVDAPWGRDFDKRCTDLAALPLLADLLAHAKRFAALWAKVPASFDTSQLRATRCQAYFGTAPGDRQRIKFVLVRVHG